MEQELAALEKENAKEELKAKLANWLKKMYS